MEDLQQQVNRSAKGNEAVLYPAWEWYDWKEFLSAHFKSLRGIASYQHFRFSSDHPGEVFISKTPEDEEISVQMLRDPTFRFEAERLPRIIPAAGLSTERQSYLYRNVRRYVRPRMQNVTCPRLAEE